MPFEIQAVKVGQWTDAGPRIFYLGDCSEEVLIYTYFWILRDGTNTVLFDVGVDYADGKAIYPGMIQQADERPSVALAARGVSPEQVTHVVLSHLHWDHCTPTLDAYANARIYVQRRELETVLSPPHPWFANFTFPQTIAKLAGEWKDRVHLVDGEEEVLPGLRAFWTGGHTPGHQSLLVETADGPVVLAGDVVFYGRSLADDAPCGFNSSLVECLLAMERMRQMGCPVVPGHDPAVAESWGRK